MSRPPYAYQRTTAYQSRKPRAEPEHDFHCQISKYLTYACPADIEWTYTLNGVHLGHSQRKKAIEAGLRRGLGDYVFLIPTASGCAVCMMEAKAGKGVLTTEQKRWRDKMGRKWVTVDSLENVRDALISWGVKPRCEIERANRYAL